MRRLVLEFGFLASVLCLSGAGGAINCHEQSSSVQTSLNVIGDSFDPVPLSIIDESFDTAIVTKNETPFTLPVNAFYDDAELDNSDLDVDLVDTSFLQKYERELADLITVASWYFGTIIVVLEVTSYFFGYSQWFGLATLCFSGLLLEYFWNKFKAVFWSAVKLSNTSFGSMLIMLWLGSGFGTGTFVPTSLHVESFVHARHSAYIDYDDQFIYFMRCLSTAADDRWSAQFEALKVSKGYCWLVASSILTTIV
jgi:hypothetical protein